MLVSVYLEIVLILKQDRCTVCAEHTRRSEIVLDAPDGVLVDVAHVESHFRSFRNGVSVGAR
jgi:hypothetical protein